MRRTTQCASWTSFHNHIIQATPALLRAVLGEPYSEDNSGMSKTNMEWVMETETGDVFTVYDWKEYVPLGQLDDVVWHIGAKTPRGAAIAKEELTRAIEAFANRETKRLAIEHV
jgi:hypothetical protein